MNNEARDVRPAIRSRALPHPISAMRHAGESGKTTRTVNHQLDSVAWWSNASFKFAQACAARTKMLRVPLAKVCARFPKSRAGAQLRAWTITIWAESKRNRAVQIGLGPDVALKTARVFKGHARSLA